MLFMVPNTDNKLSAAVAYLVFSLSRPSMLLLYFEHMLKK